METMVLLLLMLHKRMTLIKNEEFKYTENAEQELLIDRKYWKTFCARTQKHAVAKPLIKRHKHTLTLLCLPMLSI